MSRSSYPNFRSPPGKLAGDKPQQRVGRCGVRLVPISGLVGANQRSGWCQPHSSGLGSQQRSGWCQPHSSGLGSQGPIGASYHGMNSQTRDDGISFHKAQYDERLEHRRIAAIASACFSQSISRVRQDGDNQKFVIAKSKSTGSDRDCSCLKDWLIEYVQCIEVCSSLHRSQFTNFGKAIESCGRALLSR